MNSNNSDNNFHSIFVTHHLYYIPQFVPIAKELIGRKKRYCSCCWDLMPRNRMKLQGTI